MSLSVAYHCAHTLHSLSPIFVLLCQALPLCLSLQHTLIMGRPEQCTKWNGWVFFYCVEYNKWGNNLGPIPSGNDWKSRYAQSNRRDWHKRWWTGHCQSVGSFHRAKELSQVVENKNNLFNKYSNFFSCCSVDLFSVFLMEGWLQWLSHHFTM